jgi:two-component system cell cycle sensor histidine kinase/response regulator CckA
MDHRDAGEGVGQREHELLTVAFQAAPCAIITIDAERRVQTWNGAAERIFGWSAEEVVGRPLPVVPPEMDSETRRIEARVARGNSVSGIELTRVRKNGTLIPVRLAASRLVDADSNLVGHVLIYEDLTEIRRLQDQFLQSQRLESLGRLAGGVAHDFNNLLTVINGYSRLMLTQVTPDDRFHEPLSLIVRAGERAADLTQQLLSVSRRHALALGPVDLNAVIEEAMPLLQRMAGDGIEITTRLDSRLQSARADRALIRQALLNLAVNARDSMPGGGRFLVETSNAEVDESFAANHADVQPGLYVMLAVSDSGPGMDEAARQHAFEPFFSSDAGEPSAGLGLAAVYGIARQHGGFVVLHSEPGAGSTFRIYLPAASAGPPPEEGTGSTGQERRISETVLVVDDQAEVRSFTVEVLRSHGYTVLEAASGEEGQRLCETHDGPIHLLLTDVVMPGVTGRKLAERARRARPDLKVLYVSGYAEDIPAGGAVSEPGVAYLPKPFSPQRLLSKLEDLLRPDARQRTVLIVDDEPEVRQLFTYVLSGAGFGVLTAANGREAIESVRNRPVDLVLCDLVMPEKEGLETIQQLRASHPGMKVVAVSGAFGGSFLKAARLMGASATLSKPVSPEKLVQTITDALAAD